MEIDQVLSVISDDRCSGRNSLAEIVDTIDEEVISVVILDLLWLVKRKRITTLYPIVKLCLETDCGQNEASDKNI